VNGRLPSGNNYDLSFRVARHPVGKTWKTPGAIAVGWIVAVASVNLVVRTERFQKNRLRSAMLNKTEYDSEVVPCATCPGVFEGAMQLVRSQME